MLQHPEQARDLARFLPRETFTSVQLRELYETIVVLAEAGDAVDEIIVAWEHTRFQAYNRTINAAEPHEEPAEPDEAYLARLANAPLTISSAVEAARDLLAQDTRTDLTQGAADDQQP